MPDPVARHNYQNSGLLLHTGAKPRAYDPREEKYRLTRTVDVTGVDLSKPYSLLRRDASSNPWDPRPAIKNQGQKGACAAYAACACAECSSWQGGNGQPVLLSGSDLYERVRKVENGPNWTQDTGSTLADNLDLAMAGLYSETEAPESDDLARNYDAETAGKQTYDYVLGHQPFYPGEMPDPDFFTKAIAASIQQGMVVEIGTNWPQSWFNPDPRGLVPMTGLSAIAGGHAFYAWQVLPILGGVVCMANQWSPQWNPQVSANGYDLRPGDFLVPFAALRVKNLFFEGRAVSWQPVAPKPDPNPNPAPSGTCKQAALALAQPVVQGFAAALSKAPKSTKARYELLGAQAVGDALAAMPE